MASNAEIRRLRQKISQHEFFRHPACDGDTSCVYCGMPASTDDHFLPLKLVYTLTVLDPTRDVFYRGWLFLVPACNECNSMIGDRVFDSVEEKRSAIQEMLRHKYKFLLDLPDWSEAELADIGEDLAAAIRANTAKRNELHFRTMYEPAYEIGPIEK